MGALDGKIDARQTLALRATSDLKGDIKTQTLIVEPNAKFNGTCSMNNTDNKVAK